MMEACGACKTQTEEKSDKSHPSVIEGSGWHSWQGWLQTVTCVNTTISTKILDSFSYFRLFAPVVATRNHIQSIRGFQFVIAFSMHVTLCISSRLRTSLRRKLLSAPMELLFWCDLAEDPTRDLPVSGWKVYLEETAGKWVTFKFFGE